MGYFAFRYLPNFYYWGLNQYITQKVLGSASLAEGQKGLVLAASLKLLIPFIIVIPGIIAFNLFGTEMSANAGNVMAVYEQAAASSRRKYRIPIRFQMGNV